jgi:hypothetical protein
MHRIRRPVSETGTTHAPMVTTAITPEAFAIIKATLSDRYESELRPDGNGGYQVTVAERCARTTGGDA